MSLGESKVVSCPDAAVETMPRLVHVIPRPASFPFFPTWILARPVSLDVSVAWSGQSQSGLGAFNSLSPSVPLLPSWVSDLSLFLPPPLYSFFFSFIYFAPQLPLAKLSFPHL